MRYMKSMITVLLLLSFSAHGQIISTIAGVRDMSGDTGEGVPATAAIFCFGNIHEHAGNIYVASICSGTIRMINAAGIVTTIAGTGAVGGGGDGGPATAASLISPSGITLDGAGNIYITDSTLRVRKITTDGIIHAVAGSGASAASGDGGPANAAGLTARDVAVDNAGNIYIADAGNNRVRKVDGSGMISTIAGFGTDPAIPGDGGPATAAYIFAPNHVAVDAAGNVYVADYDNKIRKINTAGIITTVAGNGTGGFSGDGGIATAAEMQRPGGMAVDADGNLYIADMFNKRVRKVTAGGIITTVAGIGVGGLSNGDGGPATAAYLEGPLSIAVDAAGNYYIADDVSSTIRKVTLPATGIASGPVAEHAALSVWPEPNDGDVSIEVSSATDEQVHITVTNIAGQKIKELWTITNKQTSIQTGAPAGIYLVTAVAADIVQTAKVVVR